MFLWISEAFFQNFFDHYHLTYFSNILETLFEDGKSIFKNLNENLDAIQDAYDMSNLKMTWHSIGGIITAALILIYGKEGYFNIINYMFLICYFGTTLFMPVGTMCYYVHGWWGY